MRNKQNFMELDYNKALIKKRLKEAIDYIIEKGLAKDQGEIALKLKYKRVGTISDNLNITKTVSEKFINSICINYGLNENYILNGIDNLTKADEKENFPDGYIIDNEEINSNGNKKDKRRIPVLDAEAAAGQDNIPDMTPQLHPSGYVDVGDLLRDSESAMYVYGNSMTPNYPSGCLIGLKRNYDGYIQPGETYVIETRSNRVIKRLYWNADKTGYECHSDNTMMYEQGPRKGKYFYEPFEILKEEIIRLFDVTGVIKRNRNSLIPER